MARKKGTDLELIVAAIERALEPNSVVKHDQFLPVLTSMNGASRQCDVVIYSGSERRPNVTIVEVQDRKSAVSIGTYDGWIAKRDEVGASHLICVSRKPFSKSIIEKAKQQGSRVSLIELAAGIPSELPIDFINFHYQYINLMASDIIFYFTLLKGYEKFLTEEDSEDIKHIGWKEKKLKNNEGFYISIHDVLVSIFSSAIHQEDNQIHTGSCCFSFIQNEQLRFFFDVRGEKIPVLLNVELNDYKYESHNFAMDVAVYRTKGKGDYGWFFEASHESAQGTVNIKIPIVRHESSGGYMMLDIIADVPFDFTGIFLPMNNR